jgi:O-antigen/teichoic acid export membrane protein
LNIKKVISNFIKKLRENTFFKNIAIVAGGNAIAKIIGIVFTPIITRLYSPTDFGVFNIFMSVVGIAGSLATLRYAGTIPLAKDEKLSDNLLKLCFLITFSLSIVWVIGIALFGNFFTVQFSAEKLQPYLWLMPIVFLGKGVYEALNNWAVRNKDFKLITRTKISQSVSSTAIKLGFGIAKVTPLGLFLGHFALEAAGITSLTSKLLQKRKDIFKHFSWKEIKEAATRYRDFPLIQSWSQLLLAFGANLPILLLGAFYNTEIVGIYGLANSMINLPMDLIGQSVAQVYYAEISKYGKNNPEKIYALSVSIIKKLFFVGLIPVGIVLAFGPWLFQLVFGAEWHDAGIYAQLLTFLILTRFISSPIANILNVFEKQRLQLALNIIRVALVVFVFFISNLLNLNILYAIGIYSFSMTFYYAFLLIIILKIVKNSSTEKSPNINSIQ